MRPLRCSGQPCRPTASNLTKELRSVTIRSTWVHIVPGFAWFRASTEPRRVGKCCWCDRVAFDR